MADKKDFSHLEPKFQELMNVTREKDIQAVLTGILGEWARIKNEHFQPESNGYIDLFCRQYMFAIEVKPRNDCSPDTVRGNETQGEQVIRYLKGLKKGSEQDLFTYNRNWRGFLTDGEIWYGWTTSPHSDPKLHTQGQRITDFQGFLQFLETHVFPSEAKGKPEPDHNFPVHIQTFTREVASLGENLGSVPFYLTKYESWRLALQRTGLLNPADSCPDREASLFANHTVLVATARIILEILHGNQEIHTTEQLEKDLGHGFHAWLVEDPEGINILQKMVGVISAYDWRASSKDTLKEVYHLLIDDSERKEFGEYYTPDALARKVAAEALDPAWLDWAIPLAADPTYNGEGITAVDPSCGSGTFLMASIIQILGRIRDAHPRYINQSREICLRMICGIDTHPVAVEMATTTMETALPPTPLGETCSLHPRVFLGDSMQIHITEGVDMFRQGIEITSPAGTKLSVPPEILLGQNSDRMIQELEDAAKEDRDPDLPELATKPKSLALAKQAAKDLAKIIQAEANHIWAWKMRNLSGPMKLKALKAGRMIGNPPWIVANNMDGGTRKDAIAELAAKYGTTKKIQGSSAKGDLASIFTARVCGLYLAEKGKAAFVLPGSALINQVWGNWRSGVWGKASQKLEHTSNMQFGPVWNLDQLDPPVFENVPNGTCVVFATKDTKPQEMDPSAISRMKGTMEEMEIDTTKTATFPIAASYYLGKVKAGCQVKPQCIFYVRPKDMTPDSKDPAIAQISTWKRPKPRKGSSTKSTIREKYAGWNLNGRVETSVLLECAEAQALKPFQISMDRYLIAPYTIPNNADPLVLEVNTPEFTKTFPYAHGFCRNAQNKVMKTDPTKTLLDRLDHYNTLTIQLIPAHNNPLPGTKVFLNASGSKRLKAARGDHSLVAGTALYWIPASSQEEALYICGVVNADCMQEAYLASKTSKMHFTKSPWKNVPIPEYDPANSLHKQIAAIASLCESDFGEGGKNREDLDKAVKKLLPNHAS